MKYTQIAADAFKKLQLNAGILLKEFNPNTGAFNRADILAATGGGVSFEATPTFIDFGEDIDNVPENTKELKQLDRFEVKMSGTAKTVDTETAQFFISAADVDGNVVTPRSTLSLNDFQDLWWVGDYSDETTGENAGFLAIKMINVLSSGGFKIQSNDKGKGDFAFEFTAHYSLEDIDKVPFELYIKAGGEAKDATLSSLRIGNLTLDPEFDPAVTTGYEATTTTATNGISVTPTDEDASVLIKVNGTTIENGGSATWTIGINTVVITVTNGGSKNVYRVVVTKGE